MIRVWTDAEHARLERVIDERGIGRWRENPMENFAALVLDERRQCRRLHDDDLMHFGRMAKLSLKEPDAPEWFLVWMRGRIKAVVAEWKWRRAEVSATAEQSYRDWLDEAKRRVDLASLIALPYPSKPAGRGKWSVSCPLHADSDPSLSLDTEKGVWWCHACLIGGDVLTWLSLVENLDWADALIRLEQLSGTTRPRHQPKRRVVDLG